VFSNYQKSHQRPWLAEPPHLPPFRALLRRRTTPAWIIGTGLPVDTPPAAPLGYWTHFSRIHAFPRITCITPEEEQMELVGTHQVAEELVEPLTVAEEQVAAPKQRGRPAKKAKKEQAVVANSHETKPSYWISSSKNLV
jgi:hypothetical protein